MKQKAKLPLRSEVRCSSKTALGMEETLSTIQLDFLLPERFDLTYVGEDGEIHIAQLLSTVVLSQQWNDLWLT